MIASNEYVRRLAGHPSPAARAIRNNPTPTKRAPLARAKRLPAGARRSTVMAAVMTAITRRSITPMTRRIAIRPAQQEQQWKPRRTRVARPRGHPPATYSQARVLPGNRQDDVPSTG